jgi:hypothetical protein
MITTLTDIEEGYARVRRENGRAIGSVRSDKYGSTRTGVRWEARTGKTTVGYGTTRAEAVRKLVAYTEARDAQLDALRVAS